MTALKTARSPAANRRGSHRSLALLLLVTLTTGTALQAQSIRLAVAHTNVVDVRTGTIAADRVVLLQDGRILDIVAAADWQATTADTVIDGRDTYVLPGLIDTHVHAHDADDLALFLAHGITTVRVLDGNAGDLRRRDRQQADDFAARLFVCRQLDGLGHPGQAERAVGEAREDGYDCLKLYSPPAWPIDNYRALVTAAEATDFPLGGHLPRNLPLTALLSGPFQHSVAHLEEFLYTYFYLPENRSDAGMRPDGPQQVASLLNGRALTVITTLDQYRTIGLTATGAYDELQEIGGLDLMPPATRRRWLGNDNTYRENIPPAQGQIILDRLYPVLQRLVVELDSNGIKLAIGTDSSRNIPFSAPGNSYHRELHALAAAGLGNASILRAATVNAAELLAAPQLGVVEAGKTADLLVLTTNPLTDISFLDAIAYVIKAGAVYSRNELTAQRDRVIAARR